MKATEKTKIVRVGPYNKKELMALYGISEYRFRQWLKIIEEKEPKFGNYNGLFTTQQVKIWFIHFEPPFEIEID